VWVSGRGDRACGRCDGRGKVACQACRGVWACPGCGKLASAEYARCGGCERNNERKPGMIVCPRCKGRGEYEKTGKCPYCKQGRVTCPECGSGKK